MKKRFENRLQAINWIARYSKNEGQFEILREQLNFNFYLPLEIFRGH